MTDKIIGTEPAMPIQYDEEYGDHGRKINRVFEGLTIRQHFAAIAMQGLLSGAGTLVALEKLAYDSVRVADALITELNKNPG